MPCINCQALRSRPSKEQPTAPCPSTGERRGALGTGQGRGDGKLVPVDGFACSIPACWGVFLLLPGALTYAQSLAAVSRAQRWWEVWSGQLSAGRLCRQWKLPALLQGMPAGGSTKKKKMEEAAFSEIFLKIASLCAKNINVHNEGSIQLGGKKHFLENWF